MAEDPVWRSRRMRTVARRIRITLVVLSLVLHIRALRVGTINTAISRFLVNVRMAMEVPVHLLLTFNWKHTEAKDLPMVRVKHLRNGTINVRCGKFTYKMPLARLKRKSNTASSVGTRVCVCLTDAKQHKQSLHQDPCIQIIPLRLTFLNLLATSLEQLCTIRPSIVQHGGI